MVKEYRGIDVINGINYTQAINKYTYNQSMGFRFEILYRMYSDIDKKESLIPSANIGFFYEHFKRSNHLGFNLSIGLDICFNKEN